MSSSVDGTESKATGVGFSISSNVAVNFIHRPFVIDVPSHIGNPILSSDSGHCTIDISRVVKHGVFALKGFIDPLRSLRLDGVVDLVGAQAPGLNFSGDVKVGLNLSVVEVGNQRSSPSARGKFVRCSSSLQPRGVVGGTPGVSLIKFLLRSIELGVGAEAVTHSEDVIDVNFADETVEFVQVTSALSGNVCSERSGEIALGLLNLIIQGGIVKGMPVAHVNEGRGSVVLPVGDTVTDSEALKLRFKDRVVFTVGGVVLIDVVGHVGNVDSSVRFT